MYELYGCAYSQPEMNKGWLPVTPFTVTSSLNYLFLIQKKPIRWNFKQKGKLIYNRIFNQAQEGGITIKFWWLNFEEA
jgi:hypothetical protein